MRTKKRTPDFGAISRSSIKKDFQRVQRYPAEEKRPQIEELPKINAERRIIHISETSAYAKFARYIVGKLVRLKEKANVGGNSWYCEFVHDDDRKALNMAAGWSDNKKLYLLDCVKLSDMKIKSKTGYKIALYTFVTLTVASYMWALYSIIVWIIKAFFV